MKLLKTAAFLLCLISPAFLFSQEKALLLSLPSTKEEFVLSEPSVINTVNWLEENAVNIEVDKRKLLTANLLAWIINSPTVTVELNAKVATFTKKNPELLAAFMGGWTRYSLQNSYSQDLIKCNLAGIKSAIKVYQLGGLKKDKEMEKIIALDTSNELEAWITKRLAEK
jgi:hypothetical protein